MIIGFIFWPEGTFVGAAPHINLAWHKYIRELWTRRCSVRARARNWNRRYNPNWRTAIMGPQGIRLTCPCCGQSLHT